MESKLKIAYIYYMLRENQTGVELKAKRQAKAAIDAGLNLDIFFLNPWQEGKIDYVNYIKLPQHISPIKYFNYFFRRYHLIENCLDLSSYDYLILRYPLADKTGLAFTKKYRVVTEHHTKELVELRSQLNTAAKTPFYERVARRIILLMEERYGTAVLQNCQGIVTVTNSLRQYQEKRIEQSKLPTIAIGNGVDTIGTELTGFKPFNGKQLNLVFFNRSFATLARFRKNHRIFKFIPRKCGYPITCIGQCRCGRNKNTQFRKSKILWLQNRQGIRSDLVGNDIGGQHIDTA